jgi:hypothetical protein
MEFNKIIFTVAVAFLLICMASALILQQRQIDVLQTEIDASNNMRQQSAKVLQELQKQVKDLQDAQHEPVDVSDIYDRINGLDSKVAELHTEEWFCPLSLEELTLATRVVMAESGNQPYAGQLAVAQCIYDRMQRDDATLTEVVLAKNQFAAPYEGAVSASVIQATLDVFGRGTMVSAEPLYFFYSTRGGFYSAGHEARNYVMTIDDHKFFN